MKYNVGEKYYAPYTRGWQCLAEIVDIKDGKYVMYNKRHGRFVVTEKQIEDHN